MFRHRALPVLIGLLLLSLGLNWVYLLSGFQADDLIFLKMRQTEPLPFSRWSGVWSAPIESYDGFRALWWLEPGAQGSFFRPIPSLLIEGSVELFGETAFPLHLLGVLLHGAIGFAVFLLFRRLTGGRALPLLAAVVFVGCEDHSMGVGWIATITDILCVLFAISALLLHLEHRATGNRRALAGSLLSLVLAFGCKESAAVAPAAIVVAELILPDRLPVPPTERDEISLRAAVRRWLGRYRRWAPAAVVMGVYLVLYRLGGFGVSSLMYLNPMSMPAAYLENFALGLPIMVLALTTPIMPSFAMFLPEIAIWMAAAGAVVLLLLAWGLKPIIREPAVAYGVSMFVVALLPQLATLPSERLLYFPLVFGSYGVARLIAEARPVARRLWPDRPEHAPLVTRLWAWSLALGMVLPGLVLSAVYPSMFAKSLDQPTTELASAAELIGDRALDRVIVTNTSGMFLTLYVGDVLQVLARRKLQVHLLSSGHAKFDLERRSERSFVVRADRAGWLSNLFAKLVRAEPALSAGSRYEQPGFVATLLEVTPEGTDALAVRFDFDDPLDAEQVLLLSWDGSRFVAVDYGALGDGETRLLADTSDVMKTLMP
ncbi:MAG: glycosyltransferase family 39 protein [Deltaproteobacteria bacterium]|nr:glycosyltransferase family 39 protein [Deltaproteobacteria bacterium]MBW2537132.1 glycosyltransferase family 39 protein [Deltaproteobacteria bacterium]